MHLPVFRDGPVDSEVNAGPEVDAEPAGGVLGVLGLAPVQVHVRLPVELVPRQT